MIEKTLFHAQQHTVLVPISSTVSLFSSFFFFPSPFFILFLQPLVIHRRIITVGRGASTNISSSSDFSTFQAPLAFVRLRGSDFRLLDFPVRHFVCET